MVDGATQSGRGRRYRDVRTTVTAQRADQSRVADARKHRARCAHRSTQAHSCEGAGERGSWFEQSMGNRRLKSTGRYSRLGHKQAQIWTYTSPTSGSRVGRFGSHPLHCVLDIARLASTMEYSTFRSETQDWSRHTPSQLRLSLQSSDKLLGPFHLVYHYRKYAQVLHPRESGRFYPRSEGVSPESGGFRVL